MDGKRKTGVDGRNPSGGGSCKNPDSGVQVMKPHKEREEERFHRIEGRLWPSMMHQEQVHSARLIVSID